MPATSYRLDVYQRRDLLEEISRATTGKPSSSALTDHLRNRPTAAGQRIIEAVERTIDEVTR